MHATTLRNDALPQARVDLAAAFRQADRLGLGEGVCNHFSLLVPGTGDRFLLNPRGLHWSEIRASDLVVVDADGNVVEGRDRAEPTAFFIHSRIVDGGRLEWVSQNALRFHGRVAYEDGYDGLVLDDAEGDRICAKLAAADVLFLANHGVVVTGPDVATAFDDLYYLERACRVQVLARSTGQPLRRVAEDVCRATRRQFDAEREQSHLHFEAIKRVLAREAPEFSD